MDKPKPSLVPNQRQQEVDDHDRLLARVYKMSRCLGIPVIPVPQIETY